MKCLFWIICLTLMPLAVNAGTPTCHDHSSGSYCRYTGQVQSIYINTGNLILLYFDSPIDVSVPSEKGFHITNGSATAFLVDERPEFAKLFYSTALAAQASGREVTIQMRGTQHGYLRFDRIWLSKN